MHTMHSMEQKNKDEPSGRQISQMVTLQKMVSLSTRGGWKKGDRL